MAKVRLRHLDSTVCYENKRVVESLVARLYAEWIIRGVIAKMLPPTAGLTRLKYYNPPDHQSAAAPCNVMPAVELPGLRFMLKGKMVRNATEPTRCWLHGHNQQAEMSV